MLCGVLYNVAVALSSYLDKLSPVLTRTSRLRWCLRSRRQSLLLHGFFGGCKGTTLLRPLAAVVGSVLPSGADVSAGAAVVTTHPEPPAIVDLGHPAGARPAGGLCFSLYSRGRCQGLTKLVRDVLINVVANLIAAAVIYLAGVVTGVFKGAIALTGLALIVLMVSGVALAIQSEFTRSAVRHARLHVGFTYSFVFVTLISFGFLLKVSTDRPGVVVLFAGMFLVSVVLALDAKRKYHREVAKARDRERAHAYKGRPTRLRAARPVRIIRRARVGVGYAR
jgi:hypothetical protein